MFVIFKVLTNIRRDDKHQEALSKFKAAFNVWGREASLRWTPGLTLSVSVPWWEDEGALLQYIPSPSALPMKATFLPPSQSPSGSGDQALLRMGLGAQREGAGRVGASLPPKLERSNYEGGFMSLCL